MSEENRQEGILAGIESPADLRGLSVQELEQLAAEIRSEIIETVSRKGGHLAPSLGVVELTLALHQVFDTPRDKIIWDVGHQAYTHKLITGRRDRFETLRTYGGISGFPKRAESPYDPFDTGHSSTSISAGLGISTANEFKGLHNRVIAVIGDGSMTGGMAYEGLNQAGHMEKDLIVVLNDNEMSIAPNVGAFSSFLSRKMSGKRFVNFRKDLETFLKSIPGVGENILNIARRSEDSFITFFTPGMLFEAFKFKYIGPIHGHRLDRLIETFQNTLHIPGPVLVHVLTVKGKGYPPAEKDPAHFHGVGVFEIETGTPARAAHPPPPTYTEAFGDAMVELGEKIPELFAITAAMPEGTGLNRFSQTFPDRFLDVGIAEQHAVTFAAGLAAEGLRPVVAVYSTFLQRAYDQVIHDVCLQNLPVVFCLDRGGLVGEDGPTHHGPFDLSFLRILPNITVMAPRDENELRHMLFTALKQPGPVAVRYPRGAGTGVRLDSDFREIPIGKAERLREGSDLTIFAVGSMVVPSLAAAETLEEKGIHAEVVNVRFVKPLDPALADHALGTGRVLVVEENTRAGGLSGAVLESFNDSGILGNIAVRRMGLPDRFVEHGSIDVLRSLCGLDAASIVEEAEHLFP
ncbi:MAG: 1-deoxy-D-xylulose-5-phosphate synthase [Deltaproteobacteria bacterium]|nr:1-deoxy-D-xylulose-5-phosphate synthase [Deltaproteobacteria bacterium]